MVATNLARANIAARTAGIADHTGNHAFSKLPKPHPPKEQTADATTPCHRRPAIRKAVPKLSQSGYVDGAHIINIRNVFRSTSRDGCGMLSAKHGVY